ncbi:hypothetical protein GCM10010306_037640 [Streptomyces umbrinus]|nr:hypothetical protein GCM10010306_037640 [Streptomyces umbrinus]
MSMARATAQMAVQNVRRPGTSKGRPAPAVATIAVPITGAYQLGPRWRKGDDFASASAFALVGRPGLAWLVLSVVAVSGWAVAMNPPCLGGGRPTREYRSMRT